MNKKWIFVFLFIFIIVKIVGLYRYRDYFFDTGRMIYLYELADNLADGKGFVMDSIFIEKAKNINNETKNTDYFLLKKKIGEKHNFQKPIVTDTWGYAVLLAFLWFITGIHSFWSIQLFQIILDLMAVIALYKIGMFIFQDKRKILVGILLYLLYPEFMMMSVVASRDFFAAWGMIFSLFFYIRFLQTNKYKNVFFSGLMVAIFSWFRATIIFFPFVLLFHYYLWDKSLFRKRDFVVLRNLIIPVLILFVIPFSLQYKYYMSTYNFLIMKKIGMWEGLGEFPNKYGFVCRDTAAYKRAKELGYEGPVFTPEMAHYLQKDVERVIKKDPMFIPKTVVKRTLFFIKNLLIYNPFHEDIIKKPDSFRAFLKIIYKVAHTYISFLLLGTAFFFIDIHNWKKNILLLFVFIYKFEAHLFTHMQIRYLMEGYWSMAILSGGFIIYLWDYIKEKLDKRRNKNVRKNTI